MENLFETIREQAGREIWSRGVELARQDAVLGDSHSDGQVRLRVLDRSRQASVLVTLWTDDEDWSRDCNCKADPCHHVAAAIIALRRAQDEGQALPQVTRVSAHLLYAFRRHQGELDFERLVESDGQRTVLNIPLSQLSQGRFGEIDLAPNQLDIAIEQILGGERRGRLRAPVMMKLLPLLSKATVLLDDEPCQVHREALGLTIAIRDEGLGIHVIAKRDARILESFRNGAVLTTEGLHPQAELSIDPADIEMLRNGKVIHLRDLEKFASEKLPLWEQRFKVENRARNLPEFVSVDAELELQTERKGDGLVVTAGIVYGNPPIARISDGVFRPLGSKVPIRNHDAERALKDQLWRQWGIELYESRYYKTQDALQIAKSLKSWTGRRSGDGLDEFKQIPGTLRPEIRWDAGRIDISWMLDNGEETSPTPRKANASDVLRVWEDRQSLVPLLEGGFAALPADFMQRYGSIISNLLHAQTDKESLPKAVQPQVLQLFEELGAEIPPDLRAFSKLQSKSWESMVCVLPPRFQAKLRPYQEQGVGWLQSMQDLELGALLADDMGLGKTVQTIALLKPGSLIIAPTSVLPNWKKELQRFRPDLSVCLYHGTQRKLDPDADILLTSYGLLRSEQETFLAKSWQLVALDEAQIIKNPESKVAQAAQQMKAAFRIALSGTPVENRLDDLWSIFAFLNPGLLGSRKDFRERWSRPIENGDEAVAERLRQLLKPFVLRRLKQEVAPELPPRIEKVLYAELWPEERKLYEAIYASTRQEIVQKLQSGASVLEALEALLRMRQACCHTALIPSQEAAHSSKLTLLIDTLDTAIKEGHKALVFSQWTSLLDLLEPKLKEAGISFLRLDGSTVDRQAIVDGFQDEKGPPVLIMSLKAGGVGLNLTRADHVFILDPWWNPAAADQAADRAHRIGQERTVMVHPLVALDSIEEKIMELQNQKRALAAAALGEGSALPSLTRDDILYLLDAAGGA